MWFDAVCNLLLVGKVDSDSNILNNTCSLFRRVTTLFGRMCCQLSFSGQTTNNKIIKSIWISTWLRRFSKSEEDVGLIEGRDYWYLAVGLIHVQSLSLSLPCEPMQQCSLEPRYVDVFLPLAIGMCSYQHEQGFVCSFAVPWAATQRCGESYCNWLGWHSGVWWYSWFVGTLNLSKVWHSVVVRREQWPPFFYLTCCNGFHNSSLVCGEFQSMLRSLSFHKPS